VTNVIEGSPAEKAGIKQGDLIIKVAGQDLESREDYTSIISGYTSGDKIPLTINREGKTKEIAVAASDIPIEVAEKVALNWLGIRFREIGVSDAVRLRIKDRRGVIVTEVVRMRAADKAGIRPGDIIRQINDQIIGGEDTFKKAIITAFQQEGLLLMVQRGPYIYPVTLQP
jgi:S1-C subfamily serine protease